MKTKLIDSLQEALKLHQTGNLTDASALYNRILEEHPDNFDTIFLLGTLNLQQENLDTARIFLNKAISLNPNHASAHNNLGTALQESGRFKEAIVCYKQAIALLPDYADAHYNLGNALNEQRNLEEAVKSYKKSIKFNTNNAEAYKSLGNTLRKLGKMDDAVECYRQATKLKPNNAALFSNLGAALQESGKFEEAISCYRQAIAIKPDYAMTYCNLGSVLQELGKPNEAATSYNKALALKPDYAYAHNNLGTVLKELFRLDEATASYRRAIELKPDYTEAHFSLGTVLQELGKLEEAITSYKQAIILKPNFAEAHNNLGTVLIGLRRLDEATTSYKRAIELKSDFAEAHSNLGIALKESGLLDNAIVYCRQAIALKPESAEVHNNFGTVLFESGRFNEALTHFKRALKISPEYVDALGNLSNLWEQKNCLDDAQSTVEKGLELDLKDPFLNLTAAKLEYRQGRYQDAIKRLEKIEHLGKFNARIQYLLGQLKDRTGDSKEAFKHFIAGNRFSSVQFFRKNVYKNIYLKEIDKLIEYFKQNVVSSWTVNPVFESNDNPVFLTGFPRSGTTLLDQILDSHPKLQTLEEKPAILALKRKINNLPNGFPNALANLTREQILQIRTHYLQKVSEYLQKQNGTILIDKHPLHTSHIPLIRRIFPQAKIILALRHPCDVCLSCFMQDFTTNEAMANFLTIEDTANLYTKVMGLWKRYEEILPLDYHIVKYEDLIVDYESEISKVLDFLGVEWDDEILRYNDHAMKRDKIATASYHQVTKPIYQHARYRWQKYTEQLDPIMETLKPLIEYFGYHINENEQDSQKKHNTNITREESVVYNYNM